MGSLITVPDTCCLDPVFLIQTFAFLDPLQFAFDVGVLLVFGHLDRNYRDELTKYYSIVDKGYNSFPTRLPGTAYGKAVLVSSLYMPPVSICNSGAELIWYFVYNFVLGLMNWKRQGKGLLRLWKKSSLGGGGRDWWRRVCWICWWTPGMERGKV